ncbi:MAG: hypothetical protein QOF18_2711 [Frankiaceae bacterium]|jgi:hypothetical protein|nr:hypothetical protein [Frankiaceae bacterium]
MTAAAQPQPTKPPLYWRALRLRHVHPNGWQRAVLVEGVLSVAVVLTLSDVASAWTLLVLPAASMLIVKAHDLLAGLLEPGPPGASAPARMQKAPPPEG